ncbi:MAG: hypothetical protein JXB34_06070 [Bacteroidales bacterium]|nr:hypothetical protein [Bacteroidales bacterium]
MYKKTRLIKALTILVMMVAISFSEPGFGQMLQVGENDLNLGVGFGSPWIIPGYNTKLPLLSVSLDHGLRDDWGNGILTVGGLIGITQYAQEEKWMSVLGGETYEYGYKYTSTLFAARATYHYELFNGFDTYAGLMGGLRINTHKHYGTWPTGPSTVAPDKNLLPLGRVFIGARYGFSERVACFAELGYGFTYFNLGVSVRL